MSQSAGTGRAESGLHKAITAGAAIVEGLSRRLAKAIAFLMIASLAMANAAGNARAADKVIVGMSTDGFLYTPLFLAIDGKFFEKQGIDVQTVPFKGGGAAMAGLASRAIEFCACAFQNSINASAKGLDAKLIATMIGQYANNILIRKDIADRLGLNEKSSVEERLAAMRGLKLASSGAGSSTDALLRFLAFKAGLSVQKDITLLYMSGAGTVLTAFEQKQIDGFAYSSPTSDLALRKFGAFLLLDMSRGAIADLNGYPSIAISATSDWMKAHADLTSRFLAALGEADKLIHSNPEAAKTILRPRFKGIDDDIYAAAWDANIKAFPETPKIDRAAVEKAIAFLKQTRGLDLQKGSSADLFFTNEYLKE